MSPDPYVERVRAFMRQAYGPLPRRPRCPAPAVALGRLRLMVEELGELATAMHDNNLVAVADGLADLLYVTFGTALAYGLPIAAIFAEVHRANMIKKISRLRPGQKYSARGAAKGHGYIPPDLRQFTH